MLSDSKMKNKFTFNDHFRPESKIRLLPELDGYKGWHTIQLYSLNMILTDEFSMLLNSHGITRFHKGYDKNKVHDKILFYNESDRDLAKYLI